MKFLIDMNLPPRWVGVLGAEGIDAVHWSTAGAANAADAEIMCFARVKEFVVLTHDLDFGAILAATHGEKPSVVQIRAGNLRPDAIADAVIAAIRQMAPELEAGALLTIDPHRTRLTLLPLRRG